MILRFDFEYTSTSLVYEKILLRELKNSGLKGVLQKDNFLLSLYVKGDENELENFADNLALELPHSLFLKNSSVKVVENLPQDEYILPTYPKRELPFCPKCYKEALKKSDPFIKCEVCGYDVKKSKLIYKNFAKEIVDQNEEIYKNLAIAIKNGAIVKIKSFNGYKKIALANGKNYENFKGKFELLFRDIASVNKLIPLKKGEVLALGSFEKPVLNLPVSKQILKKFPFFAKAYHLDIRLSDDLMLEIILSYLKNEGVDFILIADANNEEEFKISLDFDSDVKPKKELKAIVLSDGRVLLTEGDKTLLPKVDHNFSPLPVKAYSKNYVAINTDKYIITYDKSKKLPALEDTFYLDKEKRYEAAHGAFYSIISQNTLFDKVVSGVYLSKEYNDKIMIYSKRFGLVDYLGFGFEYPKSVKELFNIIEKEDATSAKLVKNYRAKFGYMSDLEFDFEGMGDIYKLWGVVSIVLGFYAGTNVKNAAKILCDSAYSFKGKKGPRIDYKLIREDDKPRLDSLKVIKTAMSFRLAGLDAPTLSFGVMESFAEFVSNIMDEINQDYEIEGVCMNGSLFSLGNLVDKFYTITAKNYTVFTNEEFSLDDINLPYGIISGLTFEA